jgi:calcium channel MID1
MQLSPLQSRLAASVAASIILIVLAFTLLPGPRLALAADVSNVPNIVFDEPMATDGVHVAPREVAGDGMYRAEFESFDASILGRRTEGKSAELSDNVPASFSLKPGHVAYFMFQSGGVLGMEDVATRPVFVSANTCMQPRRAEGAAAGGSPPQLRLLFSSDPVQRPPNRTKSTTQATVFKEGAVMHRVDSTGVFYFGIEAPILPEGYAGDWGFEVAVSAEGWYHTYGDGNDNDRLIHTVAKDGNGVLLMTRDLADQEDEDQIVLDSAPPLALFAAPAGSSAFEGIRNSFCGLRTYAHVVGMHDADHANKVSVSLTTRGFTNRPKQQFWLAGLDSNTKYEGILVRTGRSPTLQKRQNRDSAEGNNGGVQVLQQTDFETQTGNIFLFSIPPVAEPHSSAPWLSSGTPILLIFSRRQLQSHHQPGILLANAICRPRQSRSL